MLIVVLVLWLEFLIDHICLDDEDTLVSSVGYFYSMTYGGKPVG